MNDEQRVWEETKDGWYSRAPAADDIEKQRLFDRWRKRELTYKEVLAQIKERGL
jgi:hypothetical protein